MTGKDKCRMLREIRRRIAEENDIELITRDCTYQGACRGTCPKCEAELRLLEQKLEHRRSLGLRVSVAALAVGMTVSMAGCVPTSPRGELEGDMPAASAAPTDDGTPAPENPLDGVEGVPAPTTPGEMELEGEVLPEDPEAQLGEPVYHELEGDIALPEEYELEGDIALLPDDPDETLGIVEYPELEGDFGYVGD